MKKTLLTLSALAMIAMAHAQTVKTEAGAKGNDGFTPTTGTPTTVPFSQPYGIAVDANDRLFISDAMNHRISVLIPGDQVLNKTGSLLAESDYVNASNSLVKYNAPKGMVFGPDGKLYVCDYNNHVIRVMNGINFLNDGQAVSTFVGEQQNFSPTGGYADGTGFDARFDSPIDIAVDANGNFYIADNWNEVIRKVTPAGVVTTLAGSPGQTGSADGTGSNARFNNILAVEMLDNTFLLVADAFNNKIRKVNINTGEVTTFAGSGTSGHQDGSASNAKFDAPSGLAVDAFGNVYVSEDGSGQSNVIRKIDANGNVTTLCGSYQSATEYADGQGADARFYMPALMAFNNAKNILYVCDAGNNTIRSIDLRPKARFFAAPSATNIGVPVQFTDQSYNSPASWLWELTPSTGFTLENGTSLTSQNPQFKFTVATTYSVKLTVTNGYGNGDTTRNNYINISNITTTDPPVADFVASDSNIFVGSTVTFTDQSINQPNQWDWTILPSTHQFVNSTSKTSQNPQVLFHGVATYSVIMKASNANGNSTKTKANYILVEPLGIKQVELNSLLTVYPNPNAGSFRVEKAEGFENPYLDYVLYDFSGKVIHTGTFSEESVEFNNLSSGVYLIKVSDGSNEYNQKVVVQ